MYASGTARSTSTPRRSTSPATAHSPRDTSSIRRRPRLVSTTIIDPLTCQPFPNHTIPQSRISTFAKGAMPYFVAPNTNAPQGNSFASIPNPIDSDQQHCRIDQNFGTKDSVFVRYSQFQYTASQITGGSPFTKEGQSHQVQKTRNVAGNYTMCSAQ